MPHRASSKGHQELLHAVDSLPRAGYSDPLDEATRLQVMQRLADNGSAVPEQVRQLLPDITAFAAARLEKLPGQPDRYVISGDELRAIIARAAIMGAAETAYGLGRSIDDMELIRSLVERPGGPAEA